MYEELGGFISIGSIFPSTWDWQDFWMKTAFLSIILAVMNILPVSYTHLDVYKRQDG